MKKLCLIMLLALMLLALIACGNTATTTVGGTEETTTAAPNTEATDTPTMVHGEQLNTEYYVAIKNQVKYQSSMAVTDYDIATSTGTYSNVINNKYKGYNIKTVVIEADGKETTYDSTVQANTALKKLAGFCVGNVELNETAKTATVKVYPADDKFVLIPSYTSVSCKAGYYLMFDFTTNIDANFMVTITETPGGSKNSAIEVQNNVRTTAGKNGQYNGMVKCNIPYAEGQTYYINICQNTSPYTAIVSIPLTITAPRYDLPFRFVFEGDWDLIENRSYIDNLLEVLYNSYPRAYKRWAYTGNEALVLRVKADSNSGSVAYNAGTLVGVSVGFANSNPDDVGLFAHEFTHAIQTGYGITYDAAWFTEAMADYGRFRFFHWGYDGSFSKIYDIHDERIHDFHGDGHNGTNWCVADTNYFTAYWDWKYPTVDKNGDGEITHDEHGLLDYIVYEAKMNYAGKALSDNPHTEGSIFNSWVEAVTGLKTMDLVREQFVEELLDGTFVFKGFRDFQDNFLIEDCYGIPDLSYPMIEDITPTAKTNPVLAAAVTTGDNLTSGAMIVMASAKPSQYVNHAYSMIDGDLATRYQGIVPKKLQSIANIDNEIVIDLREVKTFDTYTLSFYGTSAAQYAKEWEILVSTDGKTYTAVDYQKNNDKGDLSVTFDEVSARYVKIYIYKTGATRINEFMLFDLNK